MALVVLLSAQLVRQSARRGMFVVDRQDFTGIFLVTALGLQKQFPETIEVSWRDVWSNPSSVDMYRSTSYSTIYPSNVIVASGTEFRVSSARTFLPIRL